MDIYRLFKSILVFLLHALFGASIWLGHSAYKYFLVTIIITILTERSSYYHKPTKCIFLLAGGGRVERRCWENSQCRGVLLVWMIVGQGPIALAVGAGGGLFGHFSLICLFSFFSPSLLETAPI